MTSGTVRNLGYATLLMMGLWLPCAEAKTKSKSNQSLSATASRPAADSREKAGAMTLTAGPGIISGYTTLGLSVNVGLGVRVSDSLPIYAGLDTFLTVGARYSYTYDWQTGSSVGVALLGTGYYQYTFSRLSQMHIIGGMSAGPYISDHIVVAVLARPGFRYDFTKSLSITGEPVFGVMGGFVFNPRALLTFRI